jgi:hypothetical protein
MRTNQAETSVIFPANRAEGAKKTASPGKGGYGMGPGKNFSLPSLEMSEEGNFVIFTVKQNICPDLGCKGIHMFKTGWRKYSLNKAKAHKLGEIAYALFQEVFSQEIVREIQVLPQGGSSAGAVTIKVKKEECSSQEEMSRLARILIENLWKYFGAGEGERFCGSCTSEGIDAVPADARLGDPYRLGKELLYPVFIRKEEVVKINQ